MHVFVHSAKLTFCGIIGGFLRSVAVSCRGPGFTLLHTFSSEVYFTGLPGPDSAITGLLCLLMMLWDFACSIEILCGFDCLVSSSCLLLCSFSSDIANCCDSCLLIFSSGKMDRCASCLLISTFSSSTISNCWIGCCILTVSQLPVGLRLFCHFLSNSQLFLKSAANWQQEDDINNLVISIRKKNQTITSEAPLLTSIIIHSIKELCEPTASRHMKPNKISVPTTGNE